MGKSRIAVWLVVVGVLAGGLLWWRHRNAVEPAQMATTHTGSAAAIGAVTSSLQQPAHAVVTVTDAKGALAGAAVRLAGPDGDVIVIKTGVDGIVRSDLAPGPWRFGASAIDHEPGAAPSRELHAGETAQIAIRLDAGGRVLSGLVTDASSGPVVGARIDAAKVGTLARPSDAVATTTTGTDGRYKLTVAAGQLLVAASHADYAPQSRYVDVGATNATADFQLVPGGVIEGIVRDEKTRQAAGGATVEVSRDSPAMLLGEIGRRHVTAGADGKFRITGLRPGSFKLEAHVRALYSHAPTIVGLGVAEQASDVEILVGTGNAIRGLVVDEAGGPVPGVDVSTFGGDRDVSTDKQSDAKGAFVLDGLAPGHYQLIGGNSSDYVAAGMTAVELATKDVDGVRVHVRRAGHVRGHVEPRQICEVRLDFEDAMLNAQELPMLVSAQTTGPDGEFSIGPASPLPYVLAARCPSGDQGTQPVHVTPTMPDVVLNVTAGASIAGRVVDGTGKPIGAATVMAAAQTGSERTEIVNGMVTNGAQALTTADGTYELRGLTAATYRLQVLDRGRPVPMKTADAVTKVVLAATDHKTGVDLAIDRSDGVIRGTVTGVDGKPIADAWVSVQQSVEDLLGSIDHPDSETSRMITVMNGDDGDAAGSIAPALTDATGHFEIGGLPRAQWTVIAEAQAGKLRGRALKVTPDATITIQIAGVSELAGTVHVTGDPPASFVVTLDGPTRAESTFSWQGGTFSFTRVDPGTYTVHVMSSAGNGDTTVQVVAGQSASADIVLAANAIVIGKVTDGAGKPLAGIPVTTIPDNGTERVEVSLTGPSPTTGPDGSFRIETKAGTVVVIAMVPSRSAIKRGVIAEAGRTVDAGVLVVNSKSP